MRNRREKTENNKLIGFKSKYINNDIKCKWYNNQLKDRDCKLSCLQEIHFRYDDIATLKSKRIESNVSKNGTVRTSENLFLHKINKKLAKM